MVDYLNYNQCSVAFLSVDDCVVRVVDTKDMVSAVGSLYHSFIAALDALLFVNWFGNIILTRNRSRWQMIVGSGGSCTIERIEYPWRTVQTTMVMPSWITRCLRTLRIPRRVIVLAVVWMRVPRARH